VQQVPLRFSIVERRSSEVWIVSELLESSEVRGVDIELPGSCTPLDLRKRCNSVSAMSTEFRAVIYGCWTVRVFYYGQVDLFTSEQWFV
jgi:hypothetical protein